MIRYNVFIGLNDPITHKQLFDTEKYVSILKNVCKNYNVEFSFATVQGGYMYEDGTQIEETTLYLSLLNQKKRVVEEIAKDLCTYFNQEKVMVTKGRVKVYYLEGDREVQKEIRTIQRY